MRVFLSTVGTRGDVEPYLALAKGLQRAGHDVVLSSARRFAPVADAHGVPYAPTTDALLEVMDLPVAREALESLTNAAEAVRQSWRLIGVVGPIQKTLVDESWAAAQAARPDVVVYHPKAFWGPSFAAALGARAVFAPLQPFFVPTAERPVPLLPTVPIPGFNRLTYRLVGRGIAASARRYLTDWRRATGAEIPSGPVPTVHGFSRHVVPEPTDWPGWAATAGYWFLDADAPLDPALAAFLGAGPPPVYVGFGSMTGRDAGETTRTVVEAVRATGVRAVLASGWGGLAEATGDDLFTIGGAPHHALFPRCAAVVHHGGAGTTAAGLRAGRPTVVVAHFGDQPYWGRRVHALGVGPAPLLKKRLTAPQLVAAISAATTDDAMRRRAEALGKRLRAEDGVGVAVRAIEAA
ncbi:glycosyltransferase [Rubrivirga sp.]|uniref:glycosyltransferase n=1 Tax=Rubrivirga sp. TaxID=1885344 RepID=UPI003B516D90